MTWYIFSVMFAVLGCLFLGTGVYLKNRKNQINIFFALMNYCIAIWNIEELFANSSLGLLICRFSQIGGIYISTFFAGLIFSLVGDMGKRRIKNILLGMFIAASILAVIAPTSSLIIKSLPADNPYREEPGLLYPVFLLLFGGGIIYSLYHLFRSFLKTKGLKRIQFKYVFLALFIGFIGAIVFFFESY